MDILFYLLERLKQSKEVGIAGLGTFYKKKYPGSYNKEKQSFLPPKYKLYFKTDFIAENSFETYIAEKRNSSVESTQHAIKQFVAEINQKLELVHEAHLENIGRLYYTEHEGLSFEALEKFNYGSEFYGLPDIAETESSTKENHLQPVKADDNEIRNEQNQNPSDPNQTVNKEEEAEKLLPVIENIELDEVKDDFKRTLNQNEQTDNEENEVPEFIKEQHEAQPERFGHIPEPEEVKKYINLAEEEPIFEAPEFIKEQHTQYPNRFGNDPLINEDLAEEQKFSWPKIFTGIIILLIIGGITYFIKPDIFKQKEVVEMQLAPVIDTNTTAPIDTSKITLDSIAKTDSILKANQIERKTDTVNKTSIKPKALPVATKFQPAIVNSGQSTFDVIAASFRTTAKAEEFIKQMKAYGLDAKIVKLSGRMKKVSIASFKTEQEARAQRPLLSKKIKIKELDIIQINTTL